MPGPAFESTTTTSQSLPRKRLVSIHNPPPNAKSDPFSPTDPPTTVRQPDRKTIETKFQAASVSPNPRVFEGGPQTSATASNATTTLLHDFHVPIDLQTGVNVTKVSAKKNQKVTIRLDADLGQIFYQSRRARTSKSLRLLCTLLTRGSSSDLFSFPISCSTAVDLIYWLPRPFSSNREYQRTPFGVRRTLLPTTIWPRPGNWSEVVDNRLYDWRGLQDAPPYFS